MTHSFLSPISSATNLGPERFWAYTESRRVVCRSVYEALTRRFVLVPGQRTRQHHPGTPCSPSCVRRCSRKQIRLLTGHPSFVHRGRRQRCLTVIEDQTEMLPPRSLILLSKESAWTRTRERERETSGRIRQGLLGRAGKC